MKKSLSIRVPEKLGLVLGQLADQRQMSLSALIEWILGLALQANIDFSSLPDTTEQLNHKLDCRLPSEMLARLRLMCRQLKVSPSVFIRTLMYGGETNRLAIKQVGSEYMLVAKHDQN
jgi:hypothetical protein